MQVDFPFRHVHLKNRVFASNRFLLPFKFAQYYFVKIYYTYAILRKSQVDVSITGRRKHLLVCDRVNRLFLDEGLRGGLFYNSYISLQVYELIRN